LLFGLTHTIWDIIWQAVPNAQTKEAQSQIWEFRFSIARLAGLTATIGAVIALPFTLIRLRLVKEANSTAVQGLITDRINKAVEGLGAEKTIYRLGRDLSLKRDLSLPGETVEKWGFEFFDDPKFDPKTHELDAEETSGWTSVQQQVPNLEVRIGAIYSLERISQDSSRDHIQVMDILCAYVRQNASTHYPRETTFLRDDLQATLNVLGSGPINLVDAIVPA
jgi:hypothetical protein